MKVYYSDATRSSREVQVSLEAVSSAAECFSSDGSRTTEVWKSTHTDKTNRTRGAMHLPANSLFVEKNAGLESSWGLRNRYARLHGMATLHLIWLFVVNGGSSQSSSLSIWTGFTRSSSGGSGYGSDQSNGADSYHTLYIGGEWTITAVV